MERQPRARCCSRCSARSTGARTARPNPWLPAWWLAGRGGVGVLSSSARREGGD
uniref:Uncharacterized protein n=1 Tax=Arundo donax TaxID=35708 RepID=A0A0A9FQ87_ARUDO